MHKKDRNIQNRERSKKEIFNQTIDKKTRGVLFLVGLAIIIASLIGFSKQYAQLDNFTLNSYIALAFISLLLFLGLVLMLINFNFHNIAVIVIWSILGGMLFMKVIDNPMYRTGFVLFFCAIIVFVIIMMILKLYSTMTTFFLLSSIVFILLVVISQKFPSYVNSIFYIGITSYIVGYTLCGVKINKAFIGRFYGRQLIAEEFNKEVLKTHLNIIYILIFFLINASGLFYGNQGEVYNVINNCFITALAINNIGIEDIKKAL